MEKCYEYLACDKHKCIMHGNIDDINCWEVEITLCNNPGLELMKGKKKDRCKYCIYYKAVMELKNLK